MKILMLSDPCSIHTQRWKDAVDEAGHSVEVFGIPRQVTEAREGAVSKLSILKLLPSLKRKVKEFEPDILHAHYASSYGLLGSLTGFSPYIISVWGSDVYTFPLRSFLHKKILQFNLSQADQILSTSYAMAKETAKYTNKSVAVTPFGIDLNKFKAADSVRSVLFQPDDVVIGTVKSLNPKYGIDTLIKAFALVEQGHPKLSLKLLIVGEGEEEFSLKRLCQELGLSSKVIFTGHVKHKNIVKYYNMLDIAVFVSVNESFGVSVIEAMACEKPVIVSDVGGLPEVVDAGRVGMICPAGNPLATARAIERLIHSPQIAKKMAVDGRRHVKKLYNWPDNVKQMLAIYDSMVSK